MIAPRFNSDTAWFDIGLGRTPILRSCVYTSRILPREIRAKNAKSSIRSAADGSILLKFITEFDHMTPMYYIQGQVVKARKRRLIARLLHHFM